MAANPNTISAGIQETWDKAYQVTHHKKPVYPAFATMRLASQLEVGDTIHRQYRNKLTAYDMTGAGEYYRQPITDTDETLTIDKEKETSFYIKKLDEIQNHLPTRARHAYDASVAIFNQIDGDVLGSYDQYSDTVDDGDIGGTSGNGISLTTANVRKLFSKTLTKLQRNNIQIDNTARFRGFQLEESMSQRGVAIMSPDAYQVLLESLEGRETALGDSISKNGHQGRYFGFDIFVSNAVGWSGALSYGSTDVSDGDTVTVNGVQLTFKTSLSGTAGQVKIGGTISDSIDALVNAINDSENLSAQSGGGGEGTDGTDYTELSESDRQALINITATNDTSNNDMTLKSTGNGFISVSESTTPSAVSWTAETQVEHLLFGVNNAVDLVIQKTPNMLTQPRDKHVGVDVVTWGVYGFKVFNEQKVKMVDVQVRTDDR